MNFAKKICYGLIKKIKYLPASFYVKIYYEYYTGKKLNLSNPTEFNQKIQWLKVFYKPDILTTLVDKYRVRDYIKNTIGNQYLNEIHGSYKSYNEINWKELPNKFVIKGVHGCNYNLIVKDKTTLDLKKAKRLINKWLGRNYYYRSGLEWAYKNVPPRIIIEKFMKDENQNELDDYKFYCFNGVPKFVQLDIDRNTNHTRIYYDLNWKKMPITKGKIPMYKGTKNKPSNFDEMIDLVTILASPFPFVRVDFFSVNGQSIFGEMTFYPADGRIEFKPDAYNKTFGDWITLPQIPEGKTFIDTID